MDKATEKAMKKARKNYEIYKNEHPDEEHEDFNEYDDEVKGWFEDHTFFPSCGHCREYYGDEIITRGYSCRYCSSEFGTVYICRNFSWDECRHKPEEN